MGKKFDVVKEIEKQVNYVDYDGPVWGGYDEVGVWYYYDHYYDGTYDDDIDGFETPEELSKECEEWYDYLYYQLNDGFKLDKECKNTDDYGNEYIINRELRMKFEKTSWFYPDGFDEDIIGVDPLTGSIIYNWWSIGFNWIWYVEGSSPDFGDRMYGCYKMTEWLEFLTPEELQGKVPPTLVIPYDGESFQKLWEGRNHFLPDDLKHLPL